MATDTTAPAPISTCCLSGAIHSHGTPRGREETIGGLQCYVSDGDGDGDGDGNSQTNSREKSVVIVSDIFGWQLPNTRLLADNYAQKGGFTVYLPDFHQGDSLPISFLQNIEPPLKDQEHLTLADKAKNTAIVPTTLGPWMLKHREGVSRPLIDGFINTVRMLPGTNKIGCVGFCWGGRYAILQAHGQEKTGEGSSIGGVDAAVAYHPAMVEIPGDLEPVKMPLSLAVGDRDSLLDMKSVGKIQDLLAGKTEVPHELRIYEDQVHGFALRSDWSSEKDKKAMDEAEAQGIEWFKRYLA